MMDVDLSALEGRIGHAFVDRTLLQTALTHRSHGAHQGGHNERLEFLGDAVLGLVVSELLLRTWPEADEGRLSRRRAALVNAQTLADKALGIGLGPLLALGRGEEKTRGREKKSILAGAFEALLGAVFLDAGFAIARDVIARQFGDDVRIALDGDPSEYKTRLQELAQRRFRMAPEYTLVAARGPDHAKAFESCVSIGGRALGHGSGSTKKNAEQAAAREALLQLESELGPEAEVAAPAAKGLRA
jgi:ribonuclease III